MKFLSFLEDIKWSFIIALIGLVVAEVESCTVCFFKEYEYKDRIAFYQSFLSLDKDVNADTQSEADDKDKETESTAKYHEFASLVKGLLVDPDLDVTQRLQFLRKLVSQQEKYMSAYTTEEELETLGILLVQTEKIPELIQGQQKQLSALNSNLRLELWLAYYILIWGSVVFLIIGWISWRARMSYFPLKRWWFYLYLVLVFPASLLLVLTVAAIKVIIAFWHRYLRELWIGIFSDAPKSYEDECTEINKRLEKNRKAWAALFSPKRLADQKARQKMEVTDLRYKLETAGENLQILERQYFKAKEGLKSLKVSPENLCRLGQEFDQLMKHPLVKAIDIKDHKLEVYTDYLGNPSHGVVGPFRIEIDASGELNRVFIFPAHNTTRRHYQGAGNGEGGHCFGNVRKLINNLFKEYRVCEAVNVILDALQSS